MSTFRRRLTVSLLALALAPLTASAADSYRGNALIRTDAAHRIVVVLDADDDGWADEAFLFDPLRPLAAPIVPFTKGVDIRVVDSGLELDARDGSFVLRLTTTLPRQGERSVRTVGTRTDAHGIALVRYTLAALPDWEPRPPAEVDTDALVSVVYSDPPCGDSDFECTSGGEGSIGCSGGCPTGGGGGFGFNLTLAGGNANVLKQTTPPCSTMCGDGYYSCCRCDTSAAYSTGPTPKCNCKSSDSLQPCPPK